MSSKKFNARHGVSVGSTPTDVINDTGDILTNAASATKLLNARTIQLSGDVAGSATFDGTSDINITATVQANSVALGTDTTGNYMADVSAGTGVSISHTPSEGSTATISIGQAIATTDSPTFADLTLTGTLKGPATFTIDPAAVGDNTGKVVIKGDLQIDGTTTTLNSTTVTIDDVIFTLGGDTAPTSDDTLDKGIEFRWYDTQARVGFFGFDKSTGKLTYIPQATNTNNVFSGTTGEIDAKLDWSNVLNKPTIDNTTYDHLAVSTTGGALLRLHSSANNNDDVKFASGTNTTVAYTDDNTITISSVDTDSTYSIKVSTQTNGAGIDLDAGGSSSGTDTVKLIGAGGTTIARTDADTITITTTAVGDGTLTVQGASAGATNTHVALELSGAYSANSSTNRTIKPVVGPALSALATVMSGAVSSGFIKKSGEDTYSIDTNTYLTAESDTLATVTSRGATTSTDVRFGDGVATSYTYFAGTTNNYLQTFANGNLYIKTKDQTGTYSRDLRLLTGDTTFAASYSGSIVIKTGNATGGSNSTAGDVSISAGISDGSGSGVYIYGGDSNAGTVSSGGHVTIRGGSSTTTTGTTTATGGNLYLYAGNITSAANFTKNPGSVYIQGGGATGLGNINWGSVNIGTLSGNSSAGTGAVNIGNSSIVTTINGTVKLPDVGTSGFVKLGAGGQLSADTNVYLTAESDTLATVTGRGASTTTASTFSGGVTVGLIKQSQSSVNGNTATTTLNFNTSGNFYISLSTNTALSFSNLASNIGSSGYIFLKQDATGGRTFTFPTEAKTPGGRTFTQNTTANSLSLITFYVVDASTVIVNYIADFK